MDVMEASLHTITNGGGTYSSYMGVITPVKPETDHEYNWVAAINPGAGFENIIKELPNDPIERHLEIAMSLWDFVRLSHDRTYRFGTWIDGNKLYIDHVLITTRRNAETVARAKGELAIFNLITNETVRFDKKVNK